MAEVKTRTRKAATGTVKPITTKVAPKKHPEFEQLTINETHLQELVRQQSLLGEKKGVEREQIEKFNRSGILGYSPAKKDNDYFTSQRKENVISFKRNISDHIAEMEVNHARINIEEKLQNCGHVGYITEAEAAKVSQQSNIGMDILDMLTLVSLGVIIGVGVCMYRQSFYM